MTTYHSESSASSAAASAASAPAPTSNNSSPWENYLATFMEDRNVKYCKVLTDNNPRSPQPNDIRLKLKEHQLTMLNACLTLEESLTNPIQVNNTNINREIQTQIGIIGDNVGSGKTLSVLSLIAARPELKLKQNLRYKTSGFVTIKDTYNDEDTYKPYNIIVVPHTITKQWEDALDKHTSLKYICVKNKKTMDKFVELFDKDEVPDYSIIVIGSTKYRDMYHLSLKQWDCSKFKYSRILFDEADTIKTPACDTINASFTWFITSTYHSLVFPKGQRIYTNRHKTRFSFNYEYGYNNPNNPDPCQYSYWFSSGLKHTGFIRNTMNSIDESIVKHIVLRNHNDFVKSSFRLPELVMEIIKCKTPLALMVLNNNVSPEIINHINGGDIKGAIELVNCTKVSEKDLIQGATQELTTQLENKKLELQMKSQMTYSSERAKKDAIMKIKIVIMNIEKKIKSIHNKLNESNTCTICYDDVSNDTITPCCKSKFCFECISTWLCGGNQTCPFCRHKISMESLIVVSEGAAAPAPVKDELLSKLKNLDLLIERRKKEEANLKMLIFSDYDNSFGEITGELEKHNLKYNMIKGSGSTITKTISNFKKTGIDSIDVLMLNADFCGAGINLENATDIVFYHMMTTSKTKQVIGRGQRPGRKQPLKVWKLCYENELPTKE